MLNLSLVRINVRGARATQTKDGKSVLTLNNKSSLGRRNENIFIEKDDVIYRSILINGEWGTEESFFLSNFLDEDVTFIDLGANVGLISKQVLNLNNRVSKVIAIEPRNVTMENLKLNLLSQVKFKKIELVCCNFALGTIDGKEMLYTEVGNIGNSSLEKGLIPNAHSERIDSVSSGTFYDKFLKNEKAYTLKSDVQGMDATVLNGLPVEFWDRLRAAVIEIWPSDFINRDDVIGLSRLLTKKFECSFNPHFSVITDYESLVGYWLRSKGKSQNLYVRKKNEYSDL
jgi:FkbM family methyltransferase